jgi:hypothetical protein
MTDQPKPLTVLDELERLRKEWREAEYEYSESDERGKALLAVAMIAERKFGAALVAKSASLLAAARALEKSQDMLRACGHSDPLCGTTTTLINGALFQEGCDCGLEDALTGGDAALAPLFKAAGEGG